MDEIIVIRAADPDGSIFKAIVNALKDKKEAVHVADTVSSVLRVGELEIHHEYRWVMMAGRKCGSTMESMPCFYCMASSPGQVFSKAQPITAWGRNICMGRTPWRISSGG
ncbi:MAG: DNA-binding response regulator [Neglectibacter sp.]